ncbi:hypothetical protein ACPC54_26045 [Kitasatospora sp. NPDC094028]
MAETASSTTEPPPRTRHLTVRADWPKAAVALLGAALLAAQAPPGLAHALANAVQAERPLAEHVAPGVPWLPDLLLRGADRAGDAADDGADGRADDRAGARR